MQVPAIITLIIRISGACFSDEGKDHINAKRQLIIYKVYGNGHLEDFGVFLRSTLLIPKAAPSLHQPISQMGFDYG